MCEITREYNIEDFRNDIKKKLNVNEEILNEIIEMAKKLAKGILEENYHLAMENEELSRQSKKNDKVVQSANFILQRYGQE